VSSLFDVCTWGVVIQNLGVQYIASFVSQYSDILHDTVQCVLADFYRWTEPFFKAIPF